VVELLARRWDVPVTTVVAPGGFGKSTALRQAVTSGDGARGVDHLARCRPFDRDVRRLAALLLTAIHAPVPADLDDLDDPAELADRVLLALGSRTPTPTCLVIDDLHELDGDESSVALLVALVRSLPGHAHLILCGRHLPAVPLARLRAADQLLEIGPEQLRFDEGELRDLAIRLDADPELVGPLPSWPVLARLSVAAGTPASLEYLREEVLAAMAPATRAALATVVLAGGAHTELLGAVVPDLAATDLVGRVPMVDVQPDGTVVAHAFWHDVLDQIVDRRQRAELVERIARALADSGRHDEAVHLAAAHGHWDLVAELVMRALRRGGAFLTARTTAAWVELVPASHRERPELLVLRGLVDRLTRGETRGHELVERAWAAFQADGRVIEEATALSELTRSRWAARDTSSLVRIYQRAQEIDGRRPGLLDPVLRTMEAAMADLRGDPAAALAALERIDLTGLADPSFETLVHNWAASLCVLVGDTAEAVRRSDEAARASRSGRSRGGRPIQTVLARWFHGDPTVAGDGRLSWGQAEQHLSARDRFLSDVYGSVIGASFGRTTTVDADGLRDRGAGHGRDLVFAAVATAAPLVVRGDEAGAAAAFRTGLAGCGPDDPLARVELLRFLPWALILVPEWRPHLLADRLGPTQRRNAALADLFLAARTGAEPAWDELPDPAAVFTALPLPWTVELAGWARTATRPEALPLVDLTIELAGDEARGCLRGLADRGVAAGGLNRLLTEVARPPDQTVRVDVLGELRVRRGNGVKDHLELRRRRVRELLSLLALRGRVTRDTAMVVLWPDLEPSRARNNLAVTLRWLRVLLEPDRARGEAPFFVRARGESLELITSDRLSIDLHDARRAVDDGRAAEAAGRLGAAAEAYDRAVALWRGEPFEDLRYLDDTREERDAVERLLVEAACRSGELWLAGGEPFVTLARAARVLDHDPLSERAQRLVGAAHLHQRDHTAARRAVDRCRTVLGDAGVPLSEDTLMLVRQTVATRP
jgi:DNA-binding SARP family transcriptional activator